MFPERKQIVAEAFAYISNNRTVRLDALYRHITAYFEMTDEEIARKDGQGASMIKHEIRWHFRPSRMTVALSAAPTPVSG